MNNYSKLGEFLGYIIAIVAIIIIGAFLLSMGYEIVVADCFYGMVEKGLISPTMSLKSAFWTMVIASLMFKRK